MIQIPDADAFNVNFEVEGVKGNVMAVPGIHKCTALRPELNFKRDSHFRSEKEKFSSN